MTEKNKTVVIIAGPTAVGKTAVAIAVAKKLGTEIISADSRQCYKELRIGVARPSEKELSEVPHRFIASHSIHQKINAAFFEEYALAKAAELFQKNNTIVMVGGTGLYIKAFCEGLDAIPEVPAPLHQTIVENYKANGLEWLQKEVQTIDPRFYESGEIQNPQRLMRALEVAMATGSSILNFRKGKKAERPFNTIKFALELPKEDLHANINARVDQMIKAGLIEEARSLYPYKELNALQTVGYKEWFDVFDGNEREGEAAALIQRNTRQYAKRQITWFRKDANYRWLPPDAKLVADQLHELI